MAVFPYTGQSYTFRSKSFDAQRSINQFRVKSEVGDSKQVYAMEGTPGRTLFCNTGPDGIRGGREFNGRCFFVMGFKLYELSSLGVATLKGTMTTSQYGPVGMSDNGLQLIIVDGTTTGGWLLIFATNANSVTNGTFASDTAWTKGAGWSIAAGVATAAGALNTAISQTAVPIIAGVPYVVTYTITRSAGSIRPSVGGTNGTSRNSAGTYTETIIAGSSNSLIAFTGTGFTGTLDTVSMVQSADGFVQITDPYFLGADTVTFIDGYFIFDKPASDIYYLSALYNGLTGDPLMFNTASNATDNIVAVHEVHNQLWIFGAATVQVQYDNGDTFPFSNISGAYMKYGCAAAFTVQSVANTVFWVGADESGNGTVWMATGYQPQRISTNVIEQAIQGYGDISGATAFTYQEDGHYFYILNFPLADTSWAYDISMQEWHERAYFNPDFAAYERDRPQVHVFCFGKHLVGDYANGKIYEQDLDIYDHDGVEIRRLRAAPHMADDLEYIYHQKFQLDMQVGVGLESGADQDTAPQIALQWSNDGGYTWGSEHWRPVGAVGAYLVRVIWRRMGRSRDRVYRTIYTAKTKFFVIAAHLDIEKGTN